MKGSRKSAGTAVRWRGGKLTNDFRCREACGRCVVQAMQAQAAGVEALHQLPVIGALDRVAERMHGGCMLGQDQQQCQQEALDHANGADVDSGQGRRGLNETELQYRVQALRDASVAGIPADSPPLPD